MRSFLRYFSNLTFTSPATNIDFFYHNVFSPFLRGFDVDRVFTAIDHSFICLMNLKPRFALGERVEGCTEAHDTVSRKGLQGSYLYEYLYPSGYKVNPGDIGLTIRFFEFQVVHHQTLMYLKQYKN